MRAVYTADNGGQERARDVPATTYLRDRESARTLLVICGPYQMRPRSFHRAPRSARYVALLRAFPLATGISPSRDRVEILSSLLLRCSRIMYPQADPFSIGGLTAQGNPRASALRAS